MSQERIDQFISDMNSLNFDNVQEVLRNVYSDQINFVDPVKNISGIDNLTNYFQNLYSRVNKCHFTLNNYISNGQQYSLQWVMKLQHKKVAKNKEIVLEGASFIQFSDGKIQYHQDYYDLGALVYERLPILGTVVKKVRHAI